MRWREYQTALSVVTRKTALSRELHRDKDSVFETRQISLREDGNGIGRMFDIALIRCLGKHLGLFERQRLQPGDMPLENSRCFRFR